MKAIRLLSVPLPLLAPLLVPLLLPVACTTPHLLFDSRSGEAVEVRDIAAECEQQDVVFFGEQHKSDACHEQQRQLLIALHERRPDLVVSMEMFERDVQPILTAYMGGMITEAEFKKTARAWPNWNHYRPIVQFAAMQNLPVIAANAPVKLVREVSRKGGKGLAGIEGSPFVAREVHAPKDAYYEAFVKAMGEHGSGLKPDDLKRFYEAQCVRDDTMAESIADYLKNAHKEGRRPLVVHLCGSFHSDRRMGTVQRLHRRLPDLKVKVIATTHAEPLVASATSSELGDYVMLIPKETSAKKPQAHPKPKPHDPHAGHATKTAAENAGKKADALEELEEEEPDPNARPGLGFMPSYEEGEEPGCTVAKVMPGSAAAKAGMKDGDLIVKLDGEEIEDIRAYSDVLGGLRIGQKVKVVVKREGKQIELTAVVGESRR